MPEQDKSQRDWTQFKFSPYHRRILDLTDLLYSKAYGLTDNRTARKLAKYLVKMLPEEKMYHLVDDDKAMKEHLAAFRIKLEEKAKLEARKTNLASRRYKIDAAFECGVCAEEFEVGAPYVRAGGDPMCKECFLSDYKPRFEAAIKNEEAFPVTWGSTQLHPHEFPEFDDDFRTRWDLRLREYETPKIMRIYCQHSCAKVAHPDGTSKLMALPPKACDAVRQIGRNVYKCTQFLGRAMAEDMEVARAVRYRCEKWSLRPCGGSTCAHCGTSLYCENWEDLTSRILPHECNPRARERMADIDPSLVRGRDYQICPLATCARIWALGDGCNAMVCERCKTHFCFLCGAMEAHGSAHWVAGSKCPRFGRPETAEAVYDSATVNIAELVLDEEHAGKVEEFRAAAAQEPPGGGRHQELFDMALSWELEGQARAFLALAQTRFPNFQPGEVWQGVEMAELDSFARLIRLVRKSIALVYVISNGQLELKATEVSEQRAEVKEYGESIAWVQGYVHYEEQRIRGRNDAMLWAFANAQEILDRW